MRSTGSATGRPGPWRIGAATEVVLEHRHAAGEWPWAYRATQRFSLTPAALNVEMVVTNESGTTMPAGLGWHPYFPRTAGTTPTRT